MKYGETYYKSIPAFDKMNQQIKDLWGNDGKLKLPKEFDYLLHAIQQLIDDELTKIRDNKIIEEMEKE